MGACCSCLASVSSAAPESVNMVIGAAFGAVDKGWGRLLQMFVRSLAMNVAQPHLILGVDNATDAMLADDLAAFGDRALTLSQDEVNSRAKTKLWKRMGINKSRYIGYRFMLESARPVVNSKLAREVNRQLSAAEDSAGTIAVLSDGCPDWSAAPLMLLTDTRDVLFQRDPFSSARKTIKAMQAEHSQTHHAGDCLRPPLFVVAEPSIYQLGSEGKNDALLMECFRSGLEPLWEGNPVICSGTTMGVFPAVEAYVEAMIAAMPIAAPGTPATDQSLHMALVYAARRLLRGEDPSSFALAHEPAYAAMYRLAGWLAERVTPVIRAHEEGWVCTMSLFSLEHCWPIGADLRISPLAGQPACDVIHQWEREGLHHAIAEQVFMGREPGKWVCNKNWYLNKAEDCYSLGPSSSASGTSASSSASAAAFTPATEAEIRWSNASAFHPPEECAGDAEITAERHRSATSWGR